VREQSEEWTIVNIVDTKKELENKKTILEKTEIITQDLSEKEIDRGKLIEQLRIDTLELLNNPVGHKELFRKYITKIIISDTTVEVTGISDIDSKRYSGSPQYVVCTTFQYLSSSNIA